MTGPLSYSIHRDRFTGYWVGWFDAPGTRFEKAFDTQEEAMHEISAVIKNYKENN